MSDHSKRILTGVMIALGAALAFLGFMELARWLQRRNSFTEPQRRLREEVEADDEVEISPARAVMQDQPDRFPIPETGSRSAAMADMVTDTVEIPAEVPVAEMAEPLAQYLIAFHGLIEVVRNRRRENNGAETARSLTPAERNRIRETFTRLEEQAPQPDLGRLETGSLQERMYYLRVKLREALENKEYTDNDLFRINGEVRSQICNLATEIEAAGYDFSIVRQAFECS